MTHVTCRLTAENRDQLQNPTLGNRVYTTFTFYLHAHRVYVTVWHLSITPIDRQQQRRRRVCCWARAEDTDWVSCCRRRRSAANASSVVLKADKEGSTQTCYDSSKFNFALPTINHSCTAALFRLPRALYDLLKTPFDFCHKCISCHCAENNLKCKYVHIDLLFLAVVLDPIGLS